MTGCGGGPEARTRRTLGCVGAAVRGLVRSPGCVFRVGRGQGMGKQAGAGLDSALYNTDMATPRLHKGPCRQHGGHVERAVGSVSLMTSDLLMYLLAIYLPL